MAKKKYASGGSVEDQDDFSALPFGVQHNSMLGMTGSKNISVKKAGGKITSNSKHMSKGGFIEGAINGDVPQMLRMDMSGNRYQDALMSGNTNRAFGTNVMNALNYVGNGNAREDEGMKTAMTMKKGGAVKSKSFASRGDGAATKGRTRGRFV